MRPRQRGGHLGLLLLGYQLLQMGLDNIPPVTLAVLALNIYLFLAPLASSIQACVSVQQACWNRDWRRLLLAPLHHVDDWHLYFNMVSLLWKGSRLERRLGGAWFSYLLITVTLTTGVVYLLLAMGLSELTQDSSYSLQCAIGFSGVLFALKVINNYYNPGGVTNLMGIPVSNQIACWVELFLIHLLSPGTSFIGHLAGILVGLLYVKGPLKVTMQTFAGIMYGHHVFCNIHRDSVCYRHSGQSAWPQPNPELHAYTGGLSEEEQYEEAIRASLNERGVAPHDRMLYGFVNAEELRQRRLQRFDQ
uniref:Rhomboid domain containing 1 n=1 Tax=Paramormyrops kingsleyae TaxID=1676925 RepID=A0A3B3S850_9TELE